METKITPGQTPTHPAPTFRPCDPPSLLFPHSARGGYLSCLCLHRPPLPDSQEDEAQAALNTTSERIGLSQGSWSKTVSEGPAVLCVCVG